jgi:dephospho-CoA kinase
MGKSTAAAMLRRLGVPVNDADAVVHQMFAKGGGAVAAVEREFPGVVRDGAVDRAALGSRVFGDKAALARLEAIVHPLVGLGRDEFLRRMAARRAPIVVLDIPLLFEAGLDRLCDAVVVVSAPRFLQEQRVLGRAGMTRDRLSRVLSQQMPDAEKRRRADFVVETGIGRRHSLQRLARIVTMMRRRRGAHWPPSYRTLHGESRRNRHARNRP